MRYLFCLFLLLSTAAFARNDSTLTLVFMGDIMGHDAQIEGARISNADRYDFKSCFQYIRDDIESADIAIANLEVTLAGAPYRGYPSFSSPDTLVDALQYAGIDAVVMANNHCLDRRRKGLIRTCDILDEKGMPRTGVFKNADDRNKHNPLIIASKGFRLAILNYTYGTNGIPVQSPNIVNQLDTALMARDIAKARSKGVDEIVMCLHWGLEYQTKANGTQRDLAHWLQNKGVRIIIGSHPHVLQPMEMTKDHQPTLVAYSMGNFISNQRPAPRDGAALLFVTLSKEMGLTRVKNASYQLTWVYRDEKGEKMAYYVLPAQRYKDADWLQNSACERLNAFIDEAHGILKHNKGVHERCFQQPTEPLKGLTIVSRKLRVPVELKVPN
ncbi:MULTISPECIES: CapA family protein [unclassified Carboxylicivirga]|uniref:CapA family protein n=1 Tax=Carboxylicivirga TaxID=1628153 RepID=UPI003D33ED1F